MMSGNATRFAALLIALCAATSTDPVWAQSTSIPAHVKFIYCVHGANGGLVPTYPAPGYTWWSAVAVLEIDSAAEISNFNVSNFRLVDGRHETKMKRVLQIDQLDRPPNDTNKGQIEYYLNGEAHPWNGTIPAGITRLRVRVALDVAPRQFPLMAVKARCALTIGPYQVERSVDAIWAS